MEVDRALRFALGFSARPSGVSWLYTRPFNTIISPGLYTATLCKEFVRVTSKSPSSSVVRLLGHHITASSLVIFQPYQVTPRC